MRSSTALLPAPAPWPLPFEPPPLPPSFPSFTCPGGRDAGAAATGAASPEAPDCCAEMGLYEAAISLAPAAKQTIGRAVRQLPKRRGRWGVRKNEGGILRMEDGGKKEATREFTSCS